MEKDKDITDYLIFCLEHYRLSANIEGCEALKCFEHYNVFSFLEDTYEALHTQSKQYIIAEIKDYIEYQKQQSL